MKPGIVMKKFTPLAGSGTKPLKFRPPLSGGAIRLTPPNMAKLTPTSRPTPSSTCSAVSPSPNRYNDELDLRNRGADRDDDEGGRGDDRGAAGDSDDMVDSDAENSHAQKSKATIQVSLSLSRARARSLSHSLTHTHTHAHTTHTLALTNTPSYQNNKHPFIHTCTIQPHARQHPHPHPRLHIVNPSRLLPHRHFATVHLSKFGRSCRNRSPFIQAASRHHPTV